MSQCMHRVWTAATVGGNFAWKISQLPRWSKSGHQGGGDQLEISGCIFDMRVFNPFTSRNCSQNVTTTYQCHEGQKRRSYKQCICTGKHGSFAPPCQQAECERKLRWHKNSLNASSETGSVTQPTNEHHQMLDQLSFLKLQIRCISGSSSSAGHAIRTSVNVIVSAGRIPSTYAFTMTCCHV